MNDYRLWSTLREIDVATARPKGTAFRAFKARLPQLREGQDFLALDHRRDAPLAARLHADNRLYLGTVNPILLNDALTRELLRELRAAAR